MTMDAGHANKVDQSQPVSVADSSRKAARGGAGRRVAVGLLVLLFAILVPATVTTAWAHRTVLNTDAYISTIAPIASDPAVTAAVSREITDQLYAALDPQTAIASALPPKASFLAVPIANGARGYVQQGVEKVLASPQFQQLWADANRFAHAQLVSVLRGDTTVLKATSGAVVINLVPLLNQALQRSQTFVSAVVGKQVTLPTVDSAQPPAAVCARIAAELDRPVPQTCGQIVLFRGAQLHDAQRAVRAFDRALLAMLIVTPLVAVAALWLSRRRRRTLLQLTLGAMLGLVLVRRGLIWEQHRLLDIGRPENRDARKAIVDQLLSGFYNLTWWFLLGGLIIVAATLLNGPYRWATSLRGHVARSWRRTGPLASAVRRGAPDTESAAQVAWIRGHFDLLRIAGIVGAVVLILAVSLDVWGVLIVLALLALYEVSLHRLRPPTSITLPPSAPASG